MADTSVIEGTAEIVENVSDCFQSLGIEADSIDINTLRIYENDTKVGRLLFYSVRPPPDNVLPLVGF